MEADDKNINLPPSGEWTPAAESRLLMPLPGTFGYLVYSYGCNSSRGISVDFWEPSYQEIKLVLS